jgi:hypothetical protein
MRGIRFLLSKNSPGYNYVYSAHLYLGVPSEKGTRGAVKCEIDATMTQCGVDSHSRLYVRVNNGNDELASEEEDE